MNPSPESDAIRSHFISWQCRLRLQAMRELGGRPTSGMRPRVTTLRGREIAPAITVLIVEKEPEATTAMLHHIIRKTHDPYQPYEEGLRMLSSDYYEAPENFSDILTALFSAESAIAALLLEEGQCELHFGQRNQSYRITCYVDELTEDAPGYQATCCHNRIFNPAPPAQIRVLAFRPQWARASSGPAL